MNKSKIEDDIYYGDHAQTLTTNPAYEAAIARMKADLFGQFGSTGIFQRRKREELWKMIRLLDSFELKLEAMMSDALIAKSDLDREQRLKSV